MKILQSVIGAVFAFLLVGCGLSDSVVNSEKTLSKAVPQTEQRIAKIKEAYETSEDLKLLQKYAERENLKQSFVNAKTEIDRATSALKSLQQLVKEDDSGKESIAQGKINTINSLMRKAVDEANKPAARLAELKKAIDSAPQVQQSGRKDDEFIKSKSQEIVKFLEKELLTNENTLNKKDDLNKEINLAKEIATNSKVKMDIVDTEFNKKADMDIAVFLDNRNKLASLKKDITETNTRVQTKISQINSSYTKILSDMREDFYLIVGATSWDEYYDYPTEHNYVYPPSKVSENDYMRMVNTTGTLATYGNSLFGGLNVKISQSDWNKLGVNYKRGVANGDDAAEYYIQDENVRYFHKYTIVKNGKKEETDWIEVNEAEYEKQYNNLGMSIVSKPYGSYESDTITTATPAGMAFVGNKNYGEWKNDSSGNFFWHYYGIYSFLTDGGSNRYYRADYDDYRRYSSTPNRTGYYGRDKSYGTLGTRAYNTNRAKSRTFQRSSRSTNYASRSSSKTIRGAGSSARGRGPGGGGK